MQTAAVKSLGYGVYQTGSHHAGLKGGDCGTDLPGEPTVRGLADGRNSGKVFLRLKVTVTVSVGAAHQVSAYTCQIWCLYILTERVRSNE